MDRAIGVVGHVIFGTNEFHVVFLVMKIEYCDLSTVMSSALCTPSEKLAVEKASNQIYTPYLSHICIEHQAKIHIIEMLKRTVSR